MSIVLTVANQKGGVGKTTTTVNLGAGLARKGNRVLVIDFDPQASLSHFLALTGENLSHVGDWLMERKSFDEVVIKTPFAGMDAVRSNAALTGDETQISLGAVPGGSQGESTAPFKVLLRVVELVRDRYDYILIDSPPTFSLLFTNAIFATDKVLIPTKLEFLSIRALGPLLARVQEIMNYRSLEVLGIVGTLFRTNVKEQVACLDDVRSKIPDGIFKTLIRQNVTLAQSATYGKPVQFFDAQSPGSKDYEALTLEVIEKCHSPNLVEAR